jgi:PRTRC genetic system protein E
MFFKELSEMMTSGTNVSLTVHNQNGILTVSVFPKAKGLKDEAQNHLQPVVLTGNAEELDVGFFDAVRQPVQKASNMLSGMKVFEESLARVEAEKKETQEQKRNVDKQSQARKEKYENFISRADAQETAGKNDNALFLLKEARKIADGENIAKTDAHIDRIKAKCTQSSLF